MTQTSIPTRGIRRPTGRTWADIAVLLVLSVLGVLGFEPSFGGYGFLVAGLGGLALGAATGILASVFRINIIALVLVAVVGYFLVGTAIAVPQQALFGVLPTLASLESLAIGAVYGWSDIVTLRTPIGAPAYITVIPYFATWIVALVSTSLAARWLSSKPRSAWRFAITLIGPVALYLAGILIGTDVPYQAGIRGAVFAALALVWLGWRRPTITATSTGPNRLRTRKLAGTAIVVAGAVLLGGSAGFVFAPPKDERFVLREEIQPPFDPLDYPSPLSGFRHYTKQAADDVLFTVSGLKTGDTIRLATLDSYTGKLWNVTGPKTSTDGSGTFNLVGRTLPDPTFITPVVRKDVTFTIDSYKDFWLPSVGYPTSLDFTGGAAKTATDSLRYNDSTGTAVLMTGLVKGDSYTMTAEEQKVIPAEKLAKDPIATVNLPPVVGSPDVVTSKAQEFAGKAATPIAQLEAIRLALVQKGFLSHGRASDAVASRAGHGVDRISELLERPQMIGDQEQYASAFALMARSYNYPARVVMGFAPKIAEGQNSVQVTGNDVTAWVEVAFDKVGWVAFNPTPKETDIPQAQVPKPQSIPQPQVRQPPRSEKNSDDLLTPVELEKQKKQDKGVLFSLPGWVYILGLSILIPAVIVFVPMLIIAAAKRRRARRRREAARTEDRVSGAWDELLDRYSELGYSVIGKTTRVHVADDLERQVAQPVMLRSLAIRADEAVFSGCPVDDQTTERVWTEASASIEAAREAVGGLRRFLSRYRVRKARDWALRMSTRKDRD
jgi:transglutaminase-like putative cysteine protease